MRSQGPARQPRPVPAGLCELLSLSDCHLQTRTPRTRPRACSSSKGHWIDQNSTGPGTSRPPPSAARGRGRGGTGPTAMQPPSRHLHHLSSPPTPTPRRRGLPCWDSDACITVQGEASRPRVAAEPGVLGAEDQRCREGAAGLRLRRQVGIPREAAGTGRCQPGEHESGEW